MIPRQDQVCVSAAGAQSHIHSVQRFLAKMSPGLLGIKTGPQLNKISLSLPHRSMGTHIKSHTLQRNTHMDVYSHMHTLLSCHSEQGVTMRDPECMSPRTRHSSISQIWKRKKNTPFSTGAQRCQIILTPCLICFWLILSTKQLPTYIYIQYTDYSKHCSNPASPSGHRTYFSSPMKYQQTYLLHACTYPLTNYTTLQIRIEGTRTGTYTYTTSYAHKCIYT